MAWVVARKGPHGTKFKACYRDPSGAERSASTYPSRRAAERAGQREEQRVREGRWHDYSLGATTFREYVEKTWLPSKHIELTTRAAYHSNLDKHFLWQPLDGADPAVERSGVGDHGDRTRPGSQVGAEVSRHAALDLPASAAGLGDLDQSLRAHGAVQGRAASIEDSDA
jgi:hypothetical protein